MKRILRFSAASLLNLALVLNSGCESRATTFSTGASPQSQPSKAATQPRKEPLMKLTGPFEQGALIDKRHTGEGADRSPALKWSGAPAGTKSFVIIVDDPDAPSPKRPAATPWVHWVMYDIPANLQELAEGIPRDATPQDAPGAKQGRNSWDRDNVGYRGPMPPPGSGPHRYFFRIYAIDTELKLDPKLARKDSVLKAIEGHVLADGELMGKYERK